MTKLNLTRRTFGGTLLAGAILRSAPSARRRSRRPTATRR